MDADHGGVERELQLASVPDDELLRQLGEILRQSRQDEAVLVAHIGEVEARRLYAREAVSSMFAYCIEVLHLSEPEAVLRIRVARASRKHPILLTMLRDGRLHLSGIALLAPLLTPGNRKTLLKRATHKSKRQIEELVAALQPRPDAPAMVRKLPRRRGQTSPAPVPQLCPETAGASAPSPRPDVAERVAQQRYREAADGGGGVLRSDSLAAPNALLCPDTVPPVPARPATVKPVALDRYRIHFTANGAFRDKLERLQDLMRATVPDGDLGAIIEKAVTEKLERLESRRFAKTKSPRKSLAITDTTPSSRHIPAPVRRAVYERDKGRCTYVDVRGRRCRAGRRLEFHHRLPFGRGGDHSARNVCLMCRVHNDLLAELDFGKEKMAAHRRAADAVSEPRVPGSRASRANRRPRGPSPPGSAPGL
jgi:hypothetical protein